MAGKFPGTQIEYTEATPSGRGQSVRAGIDVSTGAGVIGQAVAGLGGAMFDVGMKIRDAQDLIESSTLQRQITEMGALGIKTLTEEPDDTKHPQIIADYTNQINSIKGKSGRTDRSLQVFKNKYLPTFAVTAGQASNRVKIKNMDDESKDTLQAYLESGNQTGYNDTIGRRVKGGLQSKEQGTIDIRDYPVNTKFEQARVIMDINPALAIEMLEGLKGLSGKQLGRKDELLRIARGAQVDQYDALQQQFWADLRAGNFAELQDKIDVSTLPVEKKKWWTDLIEKHSKVNIHDSAVYWPLLRTAMNTPTALTEEMVAGYVSKGIDTDDYKEIMKHLDKEDDPLKADRYLIYAGELDNLYKKEGMSPLDYDTKNEKLKRFHETKPSAKEASEFFEELTKEAKSNFVWNMLQNVGRAAKFTLPPTWQPYKIWEKGEGKELKAVSAPLIRKDKTGQEWEYIGDNKWRKL